MHENHLNVPISDTIRHVPGFAEHISLNELEQRRCSSIQDVPETVTGAIACEINRSIESLVIHLRQINSNPVPPRVVSPNLETGEDWLCTADERVAHFRIPEIQSSSECANLVLS